MIGKDFHSSLQHTEFYDLAIEQFREENEGHLGQTVKQEGLENCHLKDSYFAISPFKSVFGNWFATSITGNAPPVSIIPLGPFIESVVKLLVTAVGGMVGCTLTNLTLA